MCATYPLSAARRAGHRLAVTLLICSGWLFASAAAGSAQTLAQCVGTGATTYSPGLLLTPQVVSRNATAIYSPCVTLDPDVTYGIITEGNVTSSLSCLAILQGSGTLITRVITWNTGETSEWQFTSSVQVLGGIHSVLQTGAITAGKFAGATAIGTRTLLAPPLIECLAPPGVTRQQGLVTLTIVGLQ